MSEMQLKEIRELVHKARPSSSLAPQSGEELLQTYLNFPRICGKFCEPSAGEERCRISGDWLTGWWSQRRRRRGYTAVYIWPILFSPILFLVRSQNFGRKIQGYKSQRSGAVAKLKWGWDPNKEWQEVKGRGCCSGSGIWATGILLRGKWPSLIASNSSSKRCAMCIAESPACPLCSNQGTLDHVLSSHPMVRG